MLICARRWGGAITLRLIDRRVRFTCVNICIEERGERNCRGDADDGRQCEHESDHDTGKVACHDGVDHDENVLITKIAEAQEDAGGEQENEEIEVHKERGPGGWLVLRNRGDDRNVSDRVYIRKGLKEEWKGIYFLA